VAEPPKYIKKSLVGIMRKVLLESSLGSALSESESADLNVPNATSIKAASVPA
jgi:hypothetical protein